jgi:hypothetical protein
MTNDPCSLLWLLWVIISNYKPLQSCEHYPWPMFNRCYHSWIEKAILSHYNSIHIPHDPWTMFTRSDSSWVLTSHYQPLQSNSHDQWPMFTRCNTWELYQATISHYNPTNITNDPCPPVVTFHWSNKLFKAIAIPYSYPMTREPCSLVLTTHRS